MPLPRNNSTLETSAGDITVYLASDLAISIRAEIETLMATIRSDFSIFECQRRWKWGQR
jgi:hypothetical protein